MNKEQQWKQIGYFDYGVIIARGDDRKIVTPGMSDFVYKDKPLEVRKKILKK